MEVLLVEDNMAIIEGLLYAFKKSKYHLTYQTTMKDAKMAIDREKIHLIILDISLPDGNGFDIFETSIKQKKIPTIFLTARDDENDIVKGLNLGAEDYMTKPFSTKELMARINKILLRKNQNEIITIQGVQMDLDKMVIKNNHHEIPFTSLELKLLHLLFLNRNKVVTRNYMIEKVWEWTGNDINDNTITVYLKRIRKKLGVDIITTVKGIGYRIDEES